MCIANRLNASKCAPACTASTGEGTAQDTALPPHDVSAPGMQNLKRRSTTRGAKRCRRGSSWVFFARGPEAPRTMLPRVARHVRACPGMYSNIIVTSMVLIMVGPMQINALVCYRLWTLSAAVPRSNARPPRRRARSAQPTDAGRSECTRNGASDAGRGAAVRVKPSQGCSGRAHRPMRRLQLSADTHKYTCFYFLRAGRAQHGTYIQWQ